MPSIPHRFRVGPALALAGFLASVAACDETTSLPDPTFTNAVDTITLTAMSNPTLQAPNAYSITGRNPVKTWQSSVFDFVFTIDAANRPALLPPLVLGLRLFTTTHPGLQQTSMTFDEIAFAVINGYIDSDTVYVAAGDRLFGRTGTVCSIGVPMYAKFEILSIDLTAQTMTFQVLADNNCGYLGLQPGLPPS